MTHAQNLAADERVTDLWVTHTTGPPPLSLLPLRTGPIACLSVRCRGDDGSRFFAEEIAGVPELSALYRADEVIPVSYERSWTVGEMTPGICLLTLFHRKPGVGHRTFLRRWYDGHTPLSLRLHPLWHYNRNEVRLLGPTDGRLSDRGIVLSGGYNGIVEEHFRRRSDLLNPLRFYGRSNVILQNMLTVLIDILGFIDLRRIETYLVRETIVKASS